ncbi:CHAT domain-containing protein [Streptomyces sp. NPDC048193]|uniref:CHAT domain-containing protein n=1 Tax=unclassified Streptomyces TaxID=2593676 RepID=UPI00342A26B3
MPDTPVTPEDLAAERERTLDALGRLSADDPDVPGMCAYVGELSHRLYHLDGAEPDGEDLHLALEAFERAFREPGPEPVWWAWRILYGHLLAIEYDDSRDPGLLDRAEELLRAGVDGLTPDEPGLDDVLALGRRVLANCAKERYLRHREDDDPGPLLDEAVLRHADALDDATPGDDDEAELHSSLGFLHLERAELRADPGAAAESARHYAAVLDAGPPDVDLPHVRHSLGLALLLRGRMTADRDLLEAARDAFGTARAELRRAHRTGGEEPDWAFRSEADAVFVRALIWSTWQDNGQCAAAEVELRDVLARPDAEDRLAPQYLDVFGRVLYERAADRDDDAGRDRGIALLRRALARWEPARDGDVTPTAFFLAAFQQARYSADSDPRRLHDVLEATGRLLERPSGDSAITRMARLLDGWARYVLADRGMLPEVDGLPQGLDVAALGQATEGMLEDFQEGRSFVDFGEEEFLRGIGRDMTSPRVRTERLNWQLEQFRAAEPGGEARAQAAAMLLSNLTVTDPEGDLLGPGIRQELREAVLQRAEADPAWAGRAHAVLGIARLQEETSSGSGAGLDEVLAHFDRAEAAGGRDDYGLALARFVAQTQRGQTGGAADDMEEGAAVWRRLRDDPGLPAHVRRTLDVQQAGFDAHTAVRRGDLAAADRHIAALAEGHAAMSHDDPSRIEAFTSLENVRDARDALAHNLGAPPLPPLTGRPGAAQLRREAKRLPRDHRAWVLGDNGMRWFIRAGQANDGPGLADAIGLLQEAHDLSAEGGDDRLRYAYGLGVAHCALSTLQFDRLHSRERLAKGIRYLEAVFEEAGGPEHRLYAEIGLALARAYRTRDDLHRRDRPTARRVGLSSLRGHTWAALLQSGTDHAALAARQATGAALEVAGWCLRDGRPEEALQALDACRGLVLHAAVASTTVPGLLAAAGRTDLADEWSASGAGEGPADPLTAARTAPSVPSSLRRRVFAALTGGDAPSAAQLLDPPAPEEIGRALRAVGKDALVYLVPAGDDVPGTALVVTSSAQVHAVPLPTLSQDAAPLKAYLPVSQGPARAEGGAPEAALASGTVLAPGRDLGPVPGDAPGGKRPQDAQTLLREQLDRLCGWAWYAAMRPLLEAFEMPGGRPPRLVLVPMGTLGLVPWHAAWEPGGPRGRRYALQAAEISYAASARLLCQVAARPAAPRTGPALVVGNPTGDLRYAGEEADAVQRVFYPHGRFLGRRTTGAADTPDGAGTPREVLDWLRGTAADEDGGVLHLACHAAVTANARRSAYLALNGGRLAAEELTDAAGGPNRRLSLVLLAACSSHVSGRGHNEAFSLSTAFLVAGADAVVGSLWPVPDEATSVLMFLTHHFLRTHGEPPAKALRRAQLWMLNPDRELPDDLPSALAARSRRIDPHDLTAWAGFTHLGR